MLQITERPNHIGNSKISTRFSTKLKEDPIIIQMTEQKLCTTSISTFQIGRKNPKKSRSGCASGWAKTERKDRVARVIVRNHSTAF
jgi:hypothetical protein